MILSAERRAIVASIDDVMSRATLIERMSIPAVMSLCPANRVQSATINNLLAGAL